MDLFNRNTNKRKFNKSNEQSIGCFKRCCTRKNQEITSIQNEKIIKTANKSINQPLKDETILNTLKQSPFYNESIFCQERSEFYYDPCIQCDVQYGPDIWEDITKNSNKKLYDDNNKFLSIERVDIFHNTRNIDDNFTHSSANKRLNSFKNNVNSFINDNIGDGIDQISIIITTISTNRHEQKEFKIDNQSSINSKKNFQSNESKKSPSNIEGKKQNLDFIKAQQNSKKTSQINDQSSLDHAFNNLSSENIVDVYNWNLTPNENNFDQEPYNWDYQEYQWSQTTQSVDKLITNQSKSSLINNNDTVLLNNDTNDRLYSIANSMKSDHRIKSIHSQQKIYRNNPEDWNHTYSNQQQKFFSNLSEYKDLVPTINSAHSSKLSYDKLSTNLSSEILHQHETDEQNDRLNQITHTKKQKSLNSDADNIPNSIPTLESSPPLTPQVTNDKDSKTHVQSLRSTSTEKQLLVSSNKKTNQLNKTDFKDKNKPNNIDFLIKHAHSHLIDTEGNRQAGINMSNPFNQLRSVYDEIMNSWRPLLERIIDFMSPSIPDTAHNINDLSLSTITSNTHSWSTFLPTETLNMSEYDDIGPWWSRRDDTYDQTPATFIFTNESSTTSYSAETITNNTQMCTSFKNRLYCAQYASDPNTYHRRCNPSITINNSSQFS